MLSAAQLDFIPKDGAGFLRAARRLKLRVSARKTGFLITGSDRIGARSSVLSKLAKARINVTAMDAVAAGGGRFGALLWVKRRDVGRARRVLGAG